MAESRADRRAKRAGRVTAAMGEDLAGAALDLLELTELAWHDCYGEITPGEDVIDDVLLVGAGSLDGLIRAVRLAVADRRDLAVAADRIRNRG